MSGTSFLSRQFIQDEGSMEKHHGSHYNQLEEACWNGLLQLLLPEIFEEPLGNKNLFMWKVTGLDKFIGMELGNIPSEKEIEFSIDPAIFVRKALLS